VLVVDDSPIFAMIAANAVTYHMPHAKVACCGSYREAEALLRTSHFETVVSGFGIGSGHTVHDIRRITEAPIVVLTGRPEGQVDAPTNSRVVQKGTGPEALRMAIGASLAR
jgi:DNA-binding NarL/FixJ family response regulator